MEHVLKVEEYQKSIPLYLFNHPSGSIHSVFENGLNICMGGKLFFIGTTKNGRNPFGIHMQQEAVHTLVSKIRVDLTVEWDSKRESLSVGNVTIDFKQGKAFVDILEQITHNPTNIPQFETFVTELITNNEPTGLGVDIEQFLLDYLTETDVTDETIQYTYQLMDALFSHDTSRVEAVLRYFLGRGKGLTPSGDDHVVGLLAVHAATNGFHKLFPETIKHLLKESITTDVAETYIAYALKGQFTSTVIEVMQQIYISKTNNQLKQSMLELLSMGHSSGVDTTFGMLIGMLALRRRENGR